MYVTNESIILNAEDISTPQTTFLGRVQFVSGVTTVTLRVLSPILQSRAMP